MNEPLSPNSKLRGKIHLRTEAMRKTMQSQIMKEMDRYEVFSTPPKDINILSWWKSHSNVLPILANIARSKLAIPASSAMSERVFSTGSNIVSKKRTSLKPNKVEQTIIINENKRKVMEFLKKTNYNVIKNEENAFLNIEIDEIVRDAEDKVKDSVVGAEAFNDSDDSNNSKESNNDNSDVESDWFVSNQIKIFLILKWQLFENINNLKNIAWLNLFVYLLLIWLGLNADRIPFWASICWLSLTGMVTSTDY